MIKCVYEKKMVGAFRHKGLCHCVSEPSIRQAQLSHRSHVLDKGIGDGKFMDRSYLSGSIVFFMTAELPQDDKATSTAVKVTKCDKYGHLLNHGSIMMNPKSQACRAVFPLSTIATRSQDVQ